MMKYLIIFIAILFIACENEIELDLPEQEQQIVVDGCIEQGKYSFVMLTKSSSYFANLDSASLRNLVVSTAKVTVSDGLETEVLTLRRDDDKFPPFYYQGNEIKGEVGKIYTITVDSEGEQYSGFTTITEPVELDSVWFELDEESDSLGNIKINFTDPELETNYYRIFTKRLGKDDDYVPVYFSTLGDGNFNGDNLSIKLIRGAISYTSIEDDIFYARGDTVLIKFCTMDQNHFEFWKAAEIDIYTSANPFAVSSNEVKTNIDNNGIGIWGGYGVKYYSIIIR